MHILQTFVKEQYNRDNDAFQTAYRAFFIGVSGRTTSSSSNRDEQHDAVCVMTTNGSLPGFEMEDECNAMAGSGLWALNKFCCFEMMRKTFNKLYFHESCVYMDTHINRRFRMSRLFLYWVNTALIKTGLFIL